ncbi:protein-glutamate methylesterase/protein-glutamine glutaminase [Paenibacillus glacialis]|uniref:Protein-glutamate methylesterase/protein-glutamine glutaminase n=1 Tax=Paenibacillus glacialis TaxID=494026 RepID=A0A168K0M1_9BACL|nr:chemotaxis response regulator protein-glutamate methylesterase [Paenibacillus glacialis]
MHYKVVVVDDSPFMRKIISDLIERDSSFQVVGTAVNGYEALMKVAELKPDIVTMDVEMPEMNGLEALKAIMMDNPIPVIMLSGINEEGMKETILALESGAFDFIRKPSASVSNDINQVGELLLEKMKVAMQAKKRRAAWQTKELVRSEGMKKQVSSIGIEKPTANGILSKPSHDPNKSLSEVINTENAYTKRTAISQKAEKKPNNNDSSRPLVSNRKPSVEKEIKASKLAKSTKESTPLVFSNSSSKISSELEGKSSSFQHLVAVGCSTGGPRALKELLERIPGELPAPVVIVQHMPPKFTKSLAQRLNSFSSLEVVEGEHGMVLHRGYAYIAPGGFHMKIVRASAGHYEISLTEEGPRNGHRPSVDTMFDSLLPFNTLTRHVVLLTGMGSDGAKAMKTLYDSGVTDTYAESEETCVVYGMPRSAVELKCVRHVLPLLDIPSMLVRMIK